MTPSNVATDSFYPGFDASVDTRKDLRFEPQLDTFRRWLSKKAKAEIEAPDFWSAIASPEELPRQAGAAGDGATFTTEEKAALHAKLAEIEDYVIRVATATDEQAGFVRRQISYLAAAIERLPKRDWLHTAVGVLFTIAVGVAPDEAREIFRFAGDQIGQALHWTGRVFNKLLQ